MSIASICVVAIFALGAVAYVWADLRASRYEVAGELTGGERAIAWWFALFGIGGVPLSLTMAVFLSTSAIAGAALDLIGNLHLGAGAPAWYPALSMASGVGIGLAVTRLYAHSANTP